VTARPERTPSSEFDRADGDLRFHETDTGRAQLLVAAQAKCSIEEALALLEETAEATDESLAVIANLVLGGDVRYDEQSSP
jgi:hypothetical protein